jgi:hypothetical protein
MANGPNEKKVKKKKQRYVEGVFLQTSFLFLILNINLA